MAQRFLVLGDNHGNTESLRRVLDDAAGESFDYAVHVGDLTDAWRWERHSGDEGGARDRGAEQLREVGPLLAELDDRARHGLVWVYGNQDYFGDLAYDLDVGTQVPVDGEVTVGGQRFANAPDLVGAEDVLVTHMERWPIVDHFDGLAHFCGNTHRGRYRGRRLDSAFLHLRDPETGEEDYGGYFFVEVDGDPPFDVELRSVGSLRRVECEVHRDRGVQFQPEHRGCMYCEDPRVLYREMAASAFHGLRTARGRDSPAAEEVVEYATTLLADPPEDFREAFADYLADPSADRYAPVAREDGELTWSERMLSSRNL